jgi:hypothetical protein
MIRLITYLLFATVSLLQAAPWPSVEFSEVRAFAWDPAKERKEVILIQPDMSLTADVINPRGALLSARQVQRLLGAEARRFEDRPVAGCYTPHNAFVFYDARHKPVAYLEICFDCGGHRTLPVDQGCDPDFSELAKICAELKLPTGSRRQ